MATHQRKNQKKSELAFETTIIESLQENQLEEPTNITIIERFFALGNEVLIAQVSFGPSDNQGYWAIGNTSSLKLYEVNTSGSSDAFTNYLGELVQSTPHTIRNYLEPPPDGKKYHAFISHAFEDKTTFVRPLANALIDLGLHIWYDEFSLKVGDSLRQSIDKGLIKSRYGIVVLSPAFFAKNWTQYELNGLVNLELGEGRKIILPIWHNVDKPKVLHYSPALADRVALVTSQLSIDEISNNLAAFMS